MKKQLLTFVLCTPLFLMAQNWEKTFTGNEAWGFSVSQTTDGGYIATGEIWSVADNSELYLLKTDANGIEQWSQTFSGYIYARGHSVEQTTDGGYIVTGWTINNSPELYLLKTDVSGIEQWSQTFSGIPEGSSVKQTADGGYVITGPTSNSSSNAALYLLRTDANGVEQWSQIFVGNGSAGGKSVEQTTDGGFIVTGMTSPSSHYSPILYLLKTDANGVEQWSQTFTGNGNANANGFSVKQTTDGGYVITGSTSNNNSELYLLKTDVNGVEQWSQTFTGNGFSTNGSSIEQTTDGGFVITGKTNQELYLVKTDGNGVEQWSQTFAGNGSSEGKSVGQTTDGGYIITGWTEGNNNYELYLVKTDGNGNVTSIITIPINTDKGELREITNYLGQETKLTKNTPLLYQYENGTVEKKIIIE